MAAFRHVLQLLVSHNWTARPLFVDFDNAWNEEEIAKLESNFVKLRPVLPPVVIITNEDPSGSKWTRDGPTPLLLKRTIALAKAMLNVLNMNYEHTKAVDLKSALLSVDMSVYDVVIEIFPKMVVRTGISDKSPSVKEPEALPVVNFDPIDELVYALNAHFQHTALFFWNRYGGDHIGMLWKPYEAEVPAKQFAMDEIDALVGQLTETQVDPTALGMVNTHDLANSKMLGELLSNKRRDERMVEPEFLFEVYIWI
ncbi:hypothetical protein OESDEN_01022 [Oesophagostomum dentatum]|uniref:Nucleolar protein 6 n=1 Tax=Oesophagostomum dentatum TaxID=61180 RepID=A0A0B1TT35_OESDE|nr:hypothetical protein OESDEN_01022 [Oesophagostomum dentatum]